MATHLRKVHRKVNKVDVVKAMTAEASKPRDRFIPPIKCSLCGKVHQFSEEDAYQAVENITSTRYL